MGQSPCSPTNNPNDDENPRSSLIDRAYGHAPLPKQHQKGKSKPDQLAEPAFAGYVAGWRQNDFDDDAQETEFQFATFQSHDGYEGDDEDSEYPDCSHLEPVPSSPTRFGSEKRKAPLATPVDERMWKERKNASPERAGRSMVRDGDKPHAKRPKEVSRPRRFAPGEREKRLNSSHAAMMRGHPPGASVKMTIDRDGEAVRA